MTPLGRPVHRVGVPRAGLGGLRAGRRARLRRRRADGLDRPGQPGRRRGGPAGRAARSSGAGGARALPGGDPAGLGRRPGRPDPPLGGRRRHPRGAGGRDASAVPLAAPVRRACSPTRSPGPDESAGVALAVENMFPVGRGPVRAVPYSPGYDPTAVGYPHYTLDLSHTAAAGSDALAMLERMGDRLGPRAPGRRHRRPARRAPGARARRPAVRRGLRAAGRLRVPGERGGRDQHPALPHPGRAGRPAARGPAVRPPAPAAERWPGRPGDPALPRGRAGRAARRRPVRRPARHRTGPSARRRTAAC